MITLDEVWKLALPDGTELAGGANGLGRKASWVARMLPRPPGFEGIKGGEIALISTRSMRLLDERLCLADLVLRLSEKHVAGIAVVGEVEHEAGSVADKCSIPLFALPDGTNLYEVEQAIMRLVVERRTELYQRSQEIFMQFTDLAIEGRGLPAILRKLSDLTGKAVALENEEIELQHFFSGSDHPLDSEDVVGLLKSTRAELLNLCQGSPASSSEPPAKEIPLPRTGYARLVVPVATKDRTWGFLSLIGEKDSLSETDKLAVTRAAAACTIEIVRDRAVLDAQDRLQADFVEDLLTGNFTNPESANSRGRRLGYVLNPPYVVLAIDTQPKQTRTATPKREGPNQDLLDQLQREITRTNGDYLSTIKDGTLFVLAPVDQSADATQLKKIGQSIALTLRSQKEDLAVAVGIGRIYPGLQNVKTAYQEARQALGMGVRVFGPDSLVFFGDLGIYRLLFSLHGTSDLEVFYQETLGALLEYDRKNGAELLKTLQAYFAACGSLTDAAERLHLHRNTLLYRLHRVREIAGIDLDDPEVRLALQLALRIGETLQATSDSR